MVILDRLVVRRLPTHWLSQIPKSSAAHKVLCLRYQTGRNAQPMVLVAKPTALLLLRLELQVDALEVFRFAKGGRVVGRVTGAVDFLELAT